MRAIDKGSEPVQLTEYRAQPGAEYDGPDFTPVKAHIRTVLLKEQGSLCAYCMQRIEAGTMRIEHWQSRSVYPSKQLDYKNLLACCDGNEGSPPGQQHCDTRKGNSDLSLNPADPAHQPRMQVRYTGDGTIGSSDTRFEGELDRVLNLNWTRLKSNRKEVVNAVLKQLGTKPGPRSRSEVKSLIDKWNRRDSDGRLQAYCDVAIYFLKKRLKATK